MSKAPEGEGCPRCGGFVYAAEQMLARGRVSRNLFYFFINKFMLQQKLTNLYSNFDNWHQTSNDNHRVIIYAALNVLHAIEH